MEEFGFKVKIGEHILIMLEGGRQLSGKLIKYDQQYKNMVIETDDGKSAFVPRRFIVAIVKE